MYEWQKEWSNELIKDQSTHLVNKMKALDKAKPQQQKVNTHKGHLNGTKMNPLVPTNRFNGSNKRLNMHVKLYTHGVWPECQVEKEEEKKCV